MATTLQMDIKAEEEEILCQDYQQNINSSHIQREKTFEANKQGTKDGAKDFESMRALRTNYSDKNNDDDDADEEHECTLCARLFQSQKLFKAHIKEHAKLDGMLSNGGGEEDRETKNADHQNITLRKRAHMDTNIEECPYKCLHCPKKFAKKRQLQGHMKRHNNSRPYKCEICSKSYPNPSYLKVHMRVHTGERPYECDLCSKTYKTKGNLKDHKRAHKWERPFKCETCSKSFYTSSSLKKHNGDHPHKCETCSGTCFNLSTYKAHMRIHTGELPYKCEICLKTFKNLGHIPPRIRPFQCAQCPKRFTTKEECENHALKH